MRNGDCEAAFAAGFRMHVDPAGDGCDVVSAVGDRIRAEFLHRINLGDLFAPCLRPDAQA
ncbi:hypothetical protein [Lysobacter sp. CA196]|uniref:hypothetical protein n=1 Tax=Lysobacter sp. CA196 TaxID=3455606 RepID=UPI003F8D362A